MSPVLEQRIVPGWFVMSISRWFPVMLGLVVLYVPTYIDLARGLWQEEPYTHGPIVLAVVAWLAWQQRTALAGGEKKSAPLAGGALLAAGLLLYAVGRSQGVALLEVGSHIPVLTGVVLLLRGWRALAQLWFPFVFLFFLVPLPGFVIELFTGPLKSLVTQAVESMLYWLGYPVARSGVVLSIGQYQLLVADACAGLNSLYSLIAMGLLYLYLTASGNLARTSILLACIVPIAIVANLARVLVLVLVTFHLGDDAGQGFLHGFAGMMLFATALLLLLGVDAALRRLSAIGRAGAPS